MKQGEIARDLEQRANSASPAETPATSSLFGALFSASASQKAVQEYMQALEQSNSALPAETPATSGDRELYREIIEAAKSLGYQDRELLKAEPRRREPN
jgi:hypothetical protein